jgi:hypothetical protein
MKNFDEELQIDIQINNDQTHNKNALVEENANQNRNSNVAAPPISNNDKKNDNNNNNNIDVSKFDETTFKMPVDNNGLFNQSNINDQNDTIESSRITLDEPVLDSLKRDLFRIYNKLKHVITPRLTSRKIEELYNWDLWGPLIFCFLLCISLSNDNNESSTFVIIFSIFWIGGLIVTFNGQFLGANIGICQMICLLGYCAFPITVGGMIIGFFKITKGWMKCVIVFIAFLWSCLASVGFVSAMVSREKELITVIPVILFFVALSLFVLNY